MRLNNLYKADGRIRVVPFDGDDINKFVVYPPRGYCWLVLNGQINYGANYDTQLFFSPKPTTDQPAAILSFANLFGITLKQFKTTQGAGVYTLFDANLPPFLLLVDDECVIIAAADINGRLIVYEFPKY